MSQRVFSVLLLLFCYTFAIAQSAADVSDLQLQQIIKEAQERGMSEEQIIAAATAKGLGPAEIAKLKERVLTMQSDKKTALATEVSTNTQRKVNDAVSADAPRESAATESIFGMSFFNNKRLSFEPNLRIPTPKNYILGTNDELVITITGFAYKNYISKISPEGTIQIENLSPIYVNGLSIEQARERIINRLKTLFGGLNSSGGGLYADVTLGNIRSIKVTVIGEASQPGTYTVASLATAFNVLYACGGPSSIGSLRNIEIIRGGKVIRTLDFYDFLLNGDQKDDILLNEQDIIRIPYVDKRVVVAGEVRNPKTFELKKNETLKDVLEYAGGFKEFAYTKTIKVKRATPIEYKIITIDQSEFATFIPQKGDVFDVDALTNKYENLVNIQGAIYRPGNYELEKDMTISQLIKKAEGLREEAFKDRIIIRRKKENFDPELISLDLNKILLGKAEDFKLIREDAVIIKTYDELRENRKVEISGQVKNSGSYEFTDNLTIAELVLLSGGFTEGADAANIEVSRRIKGDTMGIGREQTIQIFNVDVDRNLNINNGKNSFVLEPFDKVFVRKLSRYEDQKTVSIGGEVFYQGTYSLLDKEERITDLITKAGGLKTTADLESARFIRNGEIISVNLTEAMNNQNSIHNLILRNGDALSISRRNETVSVFGQVYKSLTVPYQNNLNLKDYLDLAGGVTDSAYVKKIYIKYANGSLDRTRSFFGIKVYPKIKSGSDIYVPVRRKEQWSSAERIALSTAFVSIVTVLLAGLRIFAQ